MTSKKWMPLAKPTKNSKFAEIIKTELNKMMGIVIPGKGNPSKELLKYADFIKHIRKNLLQNSQLPDPIPKTSIYKPLVW